MEVVFLLGTTKTSCSSSEEDPIFLTAPFLLSRFIIEEAVFSF
jgi:hypothetical protein